MNNNDEKLNIDDLDLFGGQEEVHDRIEMYEDDGTKTEYVVMDAIEYNKTSYILLVKSDEYELDEPTAYLFKEQADDKNDFIYVPVEDDEEYNKIVLLLQNEDADYEMKF